MYLERSAGGGAGAIFVAIMQVTTQIAKALLIVALGALGQSCVDGGGSSGASGSSFALPGAAATDSMPTNPFPAAGTTDSMGSDANSGDGGALVDTVGLVDTGAKDGGSASAADSAGPVDLGKPAAGSDLDGDGFSVAMGDCDDKNKAVHPGATEYCNDIDDDCNGSIDDFDGDNDGFFKCPGAGQDCDDTDGSVFPGAKSACAPGKDGDCDGVPDMEVDVDGDGYAVCDDCDDSDPTVNPSAKPDCGSKKDKNCDGMPDNLSDNDKDGDPSCTDCNDKDPKIYKAALELCDGVDQDCNGVIDDLDYDGDGYWACKDDCNDKDITINPGSGRNCKNNKDNDCNGKIDAQEDGDKDGFVGCQDCNDYNPLINPGGIELGGDNIDNDCDGQTDEVGKTCDKAGLSDANPQDFALAIDLCVGVQQSTFVTVAAANAKAIKQVFGAPNKPVKGPNMVVMSSGVAAAAGQTGYVVPQGGTAFSNSSPYPPVSCKNSGTVYDYTEWKLTLKVPGNAQAFSFDFNFMSAEYPEWVGTQFNDKFLAILDSKNFKGNVSFDSKGSCISINNALFDVCQGCPLGAAGLKGTGYDNGIGGGTGWLTTTAPVTPGETITVRYIIFDEGDHILDSAVIIDNFRWLAKSASNSPSTVRPGGG
ncbi:MAG: hypothetical protein EXR77_16360 [Myxococcales bacterium]|nr:hypothetical protein [Myxococcales bacterium]